MSNSLIPWAVGNTGLPGLPWNFPGKITGEGCHFLPHLII